MRDPLVAASLVEDCIDIHLARHAPSGHALYLTILAVTIACGLAMPIVQVPVTVQAHGVIRPVIERQDARSAESGIVRAVHVRDGERVRAGDTVLTLDARTIETRLAASDSVARTREQDLADLMRLLDAGDSLLPWRDLGTLHRQQQSREHAAIVTELDARARAEALGVDRLRALLAKGFITPEQIERQEAAHRAARAAVREQVERMRSSWADARTRVTEELRQLTTEQVQLRETLARHAVIAPVEGTVEMAASLSPGSVLQQGERVATISPNTDLVGEALLPARDIALVRRGTAARLMIDALNYRDWGVVDAAVIDIADDASLSGDQPVFRVRCHLWRNDLRLRGGQRAMLGKGMTFRARFVIAERSLLQLLFDDMDDWLNPTRTPRVMATGR